MAHWRPRQTSGRACLRADCCVNAAVGSWAAALVRAVATRYAWSRAPIVSLPARCKALAPLESDMWAMNSRLHTPQIQGSFGLRVNYVLSSVL